MKIPKKISDIKQVKHYKPIKYIFLAMLLIIFLDRCTWMPMPPWKETDPTNPGFNAEKFEYEDYSYGNLDKDLQPVLLKMFPQGTPKTYVDSILLERGGAKIYYDEKRDLYVYRFTGKATLELILTFHRTSSSIVVIYDENDRLKNMKSYNRYLYGGYDD